jgi:hypothetical protein
MQVAHLNAGFLPELMNQNAGWHFNFALAYLQYKGRQTIVLQRKTYFSVTKEE